MAKLRNILLFFAASPLLLAQIPPTQDGELSSTRMLSVERLTAAAPEAGPDGLSFCFLVSRTSAAQHKFAIKETRDFMVSRKSYRVMTQSALGRVFEPKMAVHDALKYAADHPEVAGAVDAAPQRSLIVTLQISGAEMKAGEAVELIIHVGFGRSPDKPEGEDLVFNTAIPEKK